MRNQIVLWPLVFAMLVLACTARSAHASETVVYYHTDALRSVSVVTNAQGQVIERTYYAPYGAVLNRPLREGPGYTGHREDAETGLVYMQQRYYDPQVSRFLSSDPVPVDDGGANFNRYWYANGNPYRSIDPDGRNPVDVLFLAVDLGKTLRTELVYGAAKISGNETVAQMASHDLRGAALDVGISAAAIISPVPGAGEVAKAAKIANAGERVVEASSALRKAAGGGEKFSKEKQALVDMAKGDKRTGMTSSDMQAYKDLNKQLPDPFPSKQVRGPEAHGSGAPHSQEPHGHVGPVDHIPIRDPKDKIP